MITRLSASIAEYFLCQKVCTEDDLPWLRYKFEKILGWLITYPSLLMLACILNVFFWNAFTESIFLLVSLMLIRVNIGGIHAATRFGCFVLSHVVYAIAILLVGPFLSYFPVICFCVFLGCGIIILTSRPHIHHDLVFSETWIKKIRFISGVTYGAIALLTILLVIIHASEKLIGYITGGMMIAVISMLVGKYINRRQKDELHKE